MVKTTETVKVNSMTKKEAIQEMNEGRKVTHRYFADDEYITMEGINMVDEHGIPFNPATFWKYRQASYWETDWRLFEERQ